VVRHSAGGRAGVQQARARQLRVLALCETIRTGLAGDEVALGEPFDGAALSAYVVKGEPRPAQLGKIELEQVLEAPKRPAAG
jgi:hypothetical protein